MKKFINLVYITKEMYQTISEVWKNYKHHLETCGGNESVFWDGWISDLSEFDLKYRDQPARYILFQNMAKGLRDATAEMIEHGK